MLSFVVSFVVILFHSLSLVITRCTTRCHSVNHLLLLVVTGCITRLSFINDPGWLLLVFTCPFSEVIQNTFFIEQCTIARFEPAYTIKNYFTCTFEEVAFRRCSFDKNLWKLFVKKLIRNEVARCQHASLRKKLFHMPLTYFAFIFSEHIMITSSKKCWKWVSTDFFRKNKRKVVLLAIYLLNYDTSKSTFVLYMTFDDVLSTTFVK